MRKMPRFLSLLLTVIMCASLFTACGEKGKVDDTINDKVIVIGETGNFEEKWNLQILA